jgi:hypothetical protein
MVCGLLFGSATVSRTEQKKKAKKATNRKGKCPGLINRESIKGESAAAPSPAERLKTRPLNTYPLTTHTSIKTIIEKTINRMAELDTRAAGTFHFSTHVFISNNEHGTNVVPNMQLDRPPNHHLVRLQQCPVLDNHYTLSVKLLHMRRRRMKIRYDTTIWFRDEEICNIRNEEVIVDAGRWMQLCVINLHEELTEFEERQANAGGILIVPGVEEHNRRHYTLSYMRVSINFVEVEEEEMVRVTRNVATFAKWAVWTLFGVAMQHALAP